MSILGLARDLPSINITAIDVVFSDDVSVTKADLAMTGVNVPSYAFGGFSYNESKDEATWTLPVAIGIDRLNLSLGGVTFPGVPGAGPVISAPAFRTGVAVLPGDFNGDNTVNSQDLVDARNGILGILDQSLDIWADLDGNGVMDLDDHITATKNFCKHICLSKFDRQFLYACWSWLILL